MSAWAGVAVAVWLLSLTVVDVRRHRLPNALTLPGAALILVGAAVCGQAVPALVGALALASGYLVVHLVSPAAMGAGDVKLALGVGALTAAFGLDAWVWAALGAPLLTALCCLVLRRRVLPHGPAMCAATAAAVAVVICGV